MLTDSQMSKFVNITKKYFLSFIKGKRELIIFENLCQKCHLISNRHFSFFEFLQTFFNYLKLVNQIQPTKAVVHLQLGLFSLSNHLLITYTQNYQIFLKFHKYNNEIVILPSCFYLPNISHKILTFKMSKHY